MATVGILFCANPPGFIPLVSKEVANVVSRLIGGGGVSCQPKSADTAASMASSMPSMPCIGAFTCAASWDSSWCIRLSNASLCSLRKVSYKPSRDNATPRSTYDATSSFGFCVLTHWSENRLHVAQGVSPSHRIFLRRHRSQALETDFLRGCQSLTDVGEKRLGPSFVGREAPR